MSLSYLSLITPCTPHASCQVGYPLPMDAILAHIQNGAAFKLAFDAVGEETDAQLMSQKDVHQLASARNL